MTSTSLKRFYVRKRYYIFTATLLVFISTCFFIYETLQSSFLEKKVTSLLTEIFREQNIPFKIKSFHLKMDTKDALLSGEVKSIDLDLEQTNTHQRIRIQSAAHYSIKGQNLELHLDPEIKVTGLPKIKANLNITVPYLRNAANFKIQKLDVDYKLQTLEEFSKNFENIEIKANELFDVGTLKVDLSEKYPHIDLNHEFNTTNVHVALVDSNSSQRTWNEPVVSLKQTLSIIGRSPIEIQSSHTEISKPYFFNVDLSSPLGELSGEFFTEQKIQPLLQKVGSFLNSDFLKSLQSDGRIKITGKILGSQDDPYIDARINLKAHTIQIPHGMGKYTITLKNFDLNTPINYPLEEFEGSLHIDEIDAELFKTKKFDALISGLGTELVLELGTKDGDIEPIVTPAFGSQIKIPKLKVRFPLVPSETGESDFNFPGIEIPLLLSMGVSGGPFQISELQKAFCLSTDKTIEGNVSFNYPRIFNSQSGLHMMGNADIDVLGGKIGLSAVRYYWKNGTPKVRFSSSWSDLDLHKIGELIKFGDMRGSLHGSLNNAEYSLTDLGPVPMEYDFTVKGSTRSGKTISFYGRAVDNILELLGSRKQEMPWFARLGINASITFRNWFPATADYMGFNAKTSGGWTEIYTFDPPEEKNHYLLSGTGFKIPLNTHGVYPAVMRTDAFQGWLWGMVDYFKKLSAERNEKSGEPSNDLECIPFWKTTN